MNANDGMQAFEEVDVAEAETRVGAGALLLDVRTPEEWAAGHAPQAVHLPLDELAARHAELPADREIVVICRSGNRSGIATEALLGGGYRAVNLAGGMLAWVSAGRPCVDAQGRPGSV